MQNVNSVTLVGNLGDDCSLRFTGKQKPVTNFKLATTEQYKDEHGDRKERTEWHRVTVWGKLAEACVNNLHKGSPVYIEGRLQTKQVDRDGVKSFVTDVIAKKIIFMDRNRSNENNDFEDEDDNELDDKTDELF